MDELTVTAADGVGVPIYWARPEDSPRATLLLMPALGIQAIGGHLATIYSGMHPQQVAGIVHLACAFPYVHDYAGGQRRMLRLLCTLIPLFRLFPGYYPGQLTGFGDRESIQLMRQWRQWALSGDFDFDDFSTPAAVARAVSPFTGAAVTRMKLGAREQGDFLGHTAWAKQPEGAVNAIAEWLDEHFPRD